MNKTSNHKKIANKTLKSQKIDGIKKRLEQGFFGFWIRQRRFTFLLMWLIIVIWLFAVYRIPKESSPDIKFGMISINTVYQWVNPQDMDNLITDKIESAVKDIKWIKKINSSSTVGFANTTIELENDADTTQALVDIKDAVDKVDLPTEAEDPVITEISTDNELMFMVLLYGDDKRYSPLYLLKRAKELKQDLESNDVINRIDINASTNGGWKVKIWWAGVDTYEIQVSLDKDKLEALHLSIFQVRQAITDRNRNQPLGNHEVANLSYDFRIQWELESITDLGNIPIQTVNGFVYLKDISKIQKKLKDDSIKRLWSFQLSWQNYIALSFNKSAGANLFASAKEAKQLLADEFHKIKYEGLHYSLMYDMADMINDDYSKLAKNGLQTLIFVFLSLLLFVGFKESIVATITLPLAFFITFIVLQKLWLSLNFLTNFSLVITFGIAIDTTIVIIEGSYEKMRQWYNPKHAILLAVRDYKLPLIAGTATTVVVFLPLLTLPGLIGKFLAFIPITIFVTLLAALVISLTINSALYYKLSKPKKYFEDEGIDREYLKAEDALLLREDRKFKTKKNQEQRSLREKILDTIAKGYARVLWKIMQDAKHRLWAIAIAMGLFLVAIVWISPSLGFNIFPSSDNSQMNISITAKKGTNKEVLDSYSRELDAVLSSIPEIKVYTYAIKSNQIASNIELLKLTQRQKEHMRSIFEISSYMDQKLDDLRAQGLKVDISILKNWPPGWTEVGIKLVADSNKKFNTILIVAKDFERYLESVKWSKNVGTSSEESPWQFVYKLKRDKLSLLGVGPSYFFGELYAITNGITAWSLNGEYDNHDIKLQYTNFDKHITPNQINDITIQTPRGGLRIGDITKYSFEQAISQITREDTKITISIGSNVEEGIPASKIQAQLVKYAESYHYPDGVHFELWWEKEANADLIQTLLGAFIVALLFIFTILVLQFNSYMQPLIIMFSIIMGLFGAIVGLKVTGNVYSLMFMIGFIALTGIVVNDAIVFLDRANQNIKRWMNNMDAIVETGKARLHPILLTTITTMLGLSSILSDAMREPLAVTIIFGIFFGSATTLFVIPAIFYDKMKFTHIIKRTIFKQTLVNLWFLAIFASVWWVIYFLGRWIHGKRVALLWVVVFVLYHSGYFIYNIRSQAQTWQSYVDKLLWLKITNQQWKLLSQRKLIQRYLIKKWLVFGPAFVGGILYLLLSTFVPALAPKIVWVLVAITYLTIISRYFYQFRTSKNNQTLHDKFVWAYISEETIAKE